MTFVLFTLLVPILGAWARPRTLPWSAQIATCFAAGLVTLTIEMWVLTMLGVRWSIPLLIALPLIAAVARASSPPSRGLPARAPERRQDAGETAGKDARATALLAIAVFTSTVLSAAATSGDFFFFWGVKGQRFGAARAIDLDFLRDPVIRAMHPDYPPLVPLYYAWTTLGTGALDWYGAMASPIFFLLATAAAVWGFTRYAGLRHAGAFTAIVTSVCALLFIRNDVAGNGEPPLIFFAVLALAALTCSREHDFVAAIALAGAALTKVEGGALVGIVVAFSWLMREGTVRERFVAGAKMAAFPLFVFGAWLVYSRYTGLAATYVVHQAAASRIDMAVAVARELSMRSWYTPWIAAIVLLFCGRARAAWPLSAATLTFLIFLVDAYARTNRPPEWSAERVLITPLMMLLFAAVAAHRARERGGGLQPADPPG